MIATEKYRQCRQCVLDTRDDPMMRFDETGLCHYCSEYVNKSALVRNPEKGKILDRLLDDMRRSGRGKKYDCLVGVSGGVDSSYVALYIKRSGLRALVVHFDNGWNSELAVKNIENIIEKTGFDLHTYVVNWNEFRDMQRAYFKADVVDIEALTDHGIYAVKHKLAKEHSIRYIISGTNIVTEGILPPHWVHRKLDWLNIKSIHDRFGEVKRKTYPAFTWMNALHFKWFYKVKVISLLDHIEYDKAKVKKEIIAELNWRDYGGKHHESFFTKFYQAHILPRKFNIDKRKAHLSTLICSGQLSKEEALLEMQKPLYDPVKLREDKEFVLKKLGFSETWFNDYMQRPAVPHTNYPSYTNKQWKWELKAYSVLVPIARFFKKVLGR